MNFVHRIVNFVCNKQTHRLLIICVFVYQICDQTVNYLQYDVTNSLRYIYTYNQVKLGWHFDVLYELGQLNQKSKIYKLTPDNCEVKAYKPFYSKWPGYIKYFKLNLKVILYRNNMGFFSILPKNEKVWCHAKNLLLEIILFCKMHM